MYYEEEERNMFWNVWQYFSKELDCRTTFIKYQYLQKPKEHTLRNVSIEDALSNSSEITHPWLLVAFSRHEWPWLSKLLSWGSTTCLMPSWSLVAVPGLQGRTRLLSWVTPKMHLKNTFHSLQSPTVFGFQVGDLQEASLYSLIRQRLRYLILCLWLQVSIKAFQKCHSTSTELSLCRKPTLLCWNYKNILRFPLHLSWSADWWGLKHVASM